MTKQLTKEQLELLAKYERYFDQAVNARYCSFPGDAGVNEMLAIWNELTGEGRRVQRGCATCIFHLVTDLGTVYYAQKKAAEKPAEPAKVEQPQPQAKVPVKPKKKAKR